MKKVVIFFDYEGVWGMPNKFSYDIQTTTKNILSVLSNNKVLAVFNSCGVIAEKYPSLFIEFMKNDHEIATHGYEHENYANISKEEAKLITSKSINAIYSACGVKPRGFRSPYLMSPVFYKKDIYEALSECGIEWTSNRQITQLDYYFKSIKLPSSVSNTFLPLVNSKLLLSETLDGKDVNLVKNINWLMKSRSIFKRGNLFEIPIYSTKDCFLFNQKKMYHPSSTNEIYSAYQRLIRSFNNSQGVFNLNFHDWIIGTENRIDLLDSIISDIKSTGAKFVTAKDLIKSYE